MAVHKSIESSIPDGFSRFAMENEAGSTVKRGFSKLTNGVGGIFKVARLSANTECIHRISKVAVAALAFAVLFAGKATGVTEIEGVFSSVKGFLDAIEIVGNIKEWGEYIQALGKPHTWKQILSGIPKITSTFLFTIGNTMQLVAFAAPLAKGVYDATKYLAFSVGNIPIFGTVMSGIFVGALGWGIIAKGVDFVKACRSLSQASDKKTTWTGLDWGEASDDIEKDKKVTSLAKMYADRAEKAESIIKDVTERKKTAEENEAAPKVEKKDLKALKKAEKQLARGKVSRWKNMAAELASTNKAVAFQEITKHKIECLKIKQVNAIKTIVKSTTGAMINTAKIILIVAAFAFAFTGLVGLPFTLGLMSLALSTQLAGLLNYVWWELCGAKPVPVRNRLISVPVVPLTVPSGAA